ncbi:hypothetical protein [Streptomyces sp. NPDC058294]|uniref:hypothetical protein n=1 Tax=Streptomyces sp. NPDC058294 TaxID=3346430 RepID=UPI0036EF533B
MTDDLSADPAPEPAPRPHRPDELHALSAPRLLSVDDHMFTAPGLPGTFRLQLFTAPGARPVAVATQIAGEEGMSLMNGVERFAGAVWERHCPDQDLPPVWVERQMELHAPGETRFRRVVFAGADRYRPQGPRWSPITHEELQDLVGATVVTDRGAGYLPRPAEPEPRLVFAEFAVTRLARPRPFREPACMPAGVPWWRRWTRQVLPRRRAARTCCWYHGGDWRAVNAMALEVLERARAQCMEPDDMEELAIAHAAAAGASRWQTEALVSLFNIANALQPASQTGYINGQHRAQAMLEAGVRRTVVLHHVDET